MEATHFLLNGQTLCQSTTPRYATLGRGESNGQCSGQGFPSDTHPAPRACCMHQDPKACEPSSGMFLTKEHSLKGRIIPQGPSSGGDHTHCAPEVTGLPTCHEVSIPGGGECFWTCGDKRGPTTALEAPPLGQPRSPAPATLTSTSNRPKPQPPGQRKPPRTGRSSSWPASSQPRPKCF